MILQHFIFGYGSLLCQHSRAVTAPSLQDTPAIPVLLKNVERLWSKHTKRKMTAMGIRLVENNNNKETITTSSSCVGVLLPVSRDELMKFDKREVGYQRMRLQWEQVHPVPYLQYTTTNEEEEEEENYAGSNEKDSRLFAEWPLCLLPRSTAANTLSSTTTTTPLLSKQNSRIWAYVPKHFDSPSPDYPIAQSYVDTILRGCLSISPEFAKEFIETTKGWHHHHVDDWSKEKSWKIDDDGACYYSSENDEEDDDTTNNKASSSSSAAVYWVDDRHDPLYKRGDPDWFRSNKQELDALLAKYRPQHFAQRVVLPPTTTPTISTSTTPSNTSDTASLSSNQDPIKSSTTKTTFKSTGGSKPPKHPRGFLPSSE